MKEYLKFIGFFSNFTEEQLEEFSNVADVISTRKNDIILEENEQGKGLYFIVKGEFNAMKKIEDKKYKRLQKLETGEFFGEMSLLDKDLNSASVLSVGDGALVFLSRETFSDLCDSNTKLSLIIIKKLAGILSERLRHMNKKYGMSVAQLQSETE